jgi:heme exporter protein B
VSFFSRSAAVFEKDAAQEFRQRIAVAAILFFAATALTLVSYAIGPSGVAPEEAAHLHAALLWVLLFFSASSGLPRSFVREEESGTALALRKAVSGPPVLAGKTAFNYALYLAVAAVVAPLFGIVLGWTVVRPGAVAVVLALAGIGLSAVSTFLAAIVSRAGQKNVLFALVAFPLLLPLLLPAIGATEKAASGALWKDIWPMLQVIVAYDGASLCAAFLLIGVVWEQ